MKAMTKARVLKHFNLLQSRWSIRECLDNLSLAAVLYYLLYRFMQSTTFSFIYTKLYKYSTILPLIVFGELRFFYIIYLKLKQSQSKKEKYDLLLKCAGAVFIALPFFIVAFLHDYKMLVYLPLLALCLVDMNPDKVFHSYLVTFGFFIICTVLCSLSGVIHNIVRPDRWNSVEDVVVGSSYGFINTTDFASYFVFYLLFLWCYLKKHTWPVTILLSLFALIISYIVYIVSLSRTSFVCGILIALIILGEAIWSNNKNPKKQWSLLFKIAPAALIAFVPVLALLFWAAMFFWTKGFPFTAELNEILSNRLGYSWNLLKEYGIHLLGSSTPLYGNGGSVIQTNEYIFFDTTFALIPIRYGILLTAVIFSLWVWMTLKALRSGNKRIAISMAIIGLHALSEHHFMDANYNLLLIMPFCAFNSKTMCQKSDATQQTRKERSGWFSIISAGQIIILCILAMPRLLSWLRTFYFLKDWASAEKQILALAFCFGIILSIYLFWKTISVIWYQRSCKAYISLGLVSLFLASSFLYINHTINNGLSESKARLDSEEKVIALIQDAAKQPVYVYEASELYQLRFGGFSNHIMTPDELWRKQEGTFITNRDNESLSFIETGIRQYTEISEYSGVYSFDPSVQSALAAAGYDMVNYYNSERNVELDYLARLNHLQQDPHGYLILNGPEDSITDNIALDQLMGSYQVSYRLQLPGYDNSIDETETVCTLRIVAYDYEKTVKEQLLYIHDFDESGQCVVTIDYTIGSRPRIKYLLLVEDNQQLLLEQIVWKRIK